MSHFSFTIPSVLLLLIIFFLIKIQIIKYAFEKIGIHERSLFLLLLLSLLGSYVNIPIWQIPSSAVPYPLIETSTFWAWFRWPFLTSTTTVAVNLGGAVIPVLISFRLMTRASSPVHTTLATLVVSLIVHAVASPAPGVGIIVPCLLPPVCAALSSLLIEGQATPQTAYIAGSIGTLIGADLSNLALLAHLGIATASIGGAGTFDGVFLSGIMAALLA
jgi:uncharacterized membrane protein